MIDIHAHLHDSAFDADRDDAVRRALDMGVTKIITIGTSIEESEKAVACAEKYEGVYVSVGIHPNELNQDSEIKNLELLMNELRSLAQYEKVVAIGECGLDYFSHGAEAVITDEEKDLQKEGFLMQKILAETLGFPLIIHTRPSVNTMDAYEDMFSLLGSQHEVLPVMVLHCYMGDTEVTKKFLGLPNVYFSFTGNITYPVKKVLIGTANDSMETIKMIPIDRILAETDCPYLAPVPYRGKRNEPVYVVEVIRQVAQLKGMVYTEAAGRIEENIRRAFPRLFV